MAIPHVEAPAGRGAVLDLAGTQRWIITLAATAVSTYRWMRSPPGGPSGRIAAHGSADHLFILLFLASTARGVGAGTARYEEDWALLESTAPAQPAVERRATWRRRGPGACQHGSSRPVQVCRHRFAKEAPYAGAFGAAVLAD
jgi:hypothetical protein